MHHSPRAWPLILLLVAIASSGGGAQQATPTRDGVSQNRMVPVGSASISGVILSAETGRPVRNARVTLTGTAGTPDVSSGRSTASQSAADGVAGGLATGTGPGQVAPSRATPPQSGPATLPLNRTTISDDEGRFTLPFLPAGRYTLLVRHDGHLPVNYGQKRYGGAGSTIALDDRQQLSLSLTLPRAGVISGTIVDEQGEPANGVQVQAWRLVNASGIRRLQPANSATTDDRGRYRLHNLQPGDYIVGAQPRPSTVLPPSAAAEIAAIEQAISEGRVHAGAAPGRPAYVTLPPPGTGRAEPNPALLPVFFPGTASPAAAALLRLAPGADLSADIALERVPATILRGTIAGARDEGSMVRISLSSDDPLSTVGPFSATVREDNGFSFTLPPGRYTVVAQTSPRPVPVVQAGGTVLLQSPPAESVPTAFARQQIVVSGEPSVELALALQPGRTISGTAIFEREPQGIRPTVSLIRAPSTVGATLGPPPNSAISPEGRFTLNAVVPGAYLFGATMSLKSAMVDGEDVLDAPLLFTGERDLSGVVLTFGEWQTGVTGTLTDRAGNAVPDVTIVMAAADDRYWTPGSRRILLRRTDPDGRFMFASPPPGDYVLAAVDEPEEGAQFDRSFLESLSTIGTRVTVAEGRPVQEDLRLP